MLQYRVGNLKLLLVTRKTDQGQTRHIKKLICLVNINNRSLNLTKVGNKT